MKYDIMSRIDARMVAFAFICRIIHQQQSNIAQFRLYILYLYISIPKPNNRLHKELPIGGSLCIFCGSKILKQSSTHGTKKS